jgi:mannose PTS system EIIA component
MATAASGSAQGDKLAPMNGILIVAHAPLASALRSCVLHVFPDSADAVSALDVLPNTPPEESLAQARILMRQLDLPQTLVLTDVFGATPCNVAQKLVDGVRSKLIAGVNLPMLLRTVSYRHESLDALVSRAMVGATQGVIQVAVTAPQNQARRTTHDQDHRDHQQ